VQSIVSVTEKVAKIPIITWESNHMGYYAYGTVQKEGNLIVGTLPVKTPEGPDGHFNETVNFEDVIRHGELLRTLFPVLNEVSILRTWAGVFGMTPDRLPYVGTFPDKENYFLNTGYSNGMCYCPICAKLTSEFILNNGKTSIPIDLLKPERYYNMKFDIPKYYSYDMLERLLGEWDL
jgi:sarcosine oxidase subunit beta